jgi:hypothetical protein
MYDSEQSPPGRARHNAMVNSYAVAIRNSGARVPALLDRDLPIALIMIQVLHAE